MDGDATVRPISSAARSPHRDQSRSLPPPRLILPTPDRRARASRR
ncbi:MAG: hypothetical protein ACK55I_26610 [bacterium]